MQHEMRLIDTNGYTVNADSAVRYGVPTAQVAAVEAELLALAGPDAQRTRELHLNHAASTSDLVNAATQRSAAGQIHARNYRVQITPPVA
ncbi:hypothetical protein ABT039_22485 [Streptomyces lasiicapitis]|uniref:hypothetical protein n=1 Tax=Streptomyces lasiicapitis TaxID=1923961 RepID=UPI003331E485